MERTTSEQLCPLGGPEWRQAILTLLTGTEDILLFFPSETCQWGLLSAVPPPMPHFICCSLRAEGTKAGQCRRQKEEGTGHGPRGTGQGPGGNSIESKGEPPRVARSFPPSQKEPNRPNSVSRASLQESQRTKKRQKWCQGGDNNRVGKRCSVLF